MFARIVRFIHWVIIISTLILIRFHPLKMEWDVVYTLPHVNGKVQARDTLDQ